MRWSEQFSNSIINFFNYAINNFNEIFYMKMLHIFQLLYWNSKNISNELVVDLLLLCRVGHIVGLLHVWKGLFVKTYAPRVINGFHLKLSKWHRKTGLVSVAHCLDLLNCLRHRNNFSKLFNWERKNRSVYFTYIFF